MLIRKAASSGVEFVSYDAAAGEWKFKEYGSIGWAVGATLGYAQSVPEKRIIACIGDGSFQVTCQDASTMIRNNQKSIIFLINNGGYTIEVEIHDGPYNVIKNWNYIGVLEAFCNGEGNLWTAKVRTEEDGKSFLVLSIPNKVIRFDLEDASFYKLCDFASTNNHVYLLVARY